MENINHEINFIKKRTGRCSNCGSFEHYFRECKEAILSLGIICFKVVNNDIQYLLIRRKTSISFNEFVRGRYEISLDEEQNEKIMLYIHNLFLEMTEEEHNYIKTLSFEELWTNIYGEKTMRNLSSEYFKAFIKYERLRKSVINHLHERENLQTIINKYKPVWNEPEWGFPKGRRSGNETNLSCAIREFAEETNLIPYDYELINDFRPVIEEYTSTNGITYKHMYFICKTDAKKEVSINVNNEFQNVEIGDIAWKNLTNILALFRDTQIKKKEIIVKVHRLIRQYLKKDDNIILYLRQ